MNPTSILTVPLSGLGISGLFWGDVDTAVFGLAAASLIAIFAAIYERFPS